MTTALAAALARAQGAGAERRLDTKGRLRTVKKAEKDPHQDFKAAMLLRAQMMDMESPHQVDLGWNDPAYRHSKAPLVCWIAPKPGFQVASILSTTRLARPGKGDHTQAFALRHSCDKKAHAAIGPIPTDNYLPERPKTSKALLVRKLIKGRK